MWRKTLLTPLGSWIQVIGGALTPLGAPNAWRDSVGPGTHVGRNVLKSTRHCLSSAEFARLRVPVLQGVSSTFVSNIQNSQGNQSVWFGYVQGLFSPPCMMILSLYDFLCVWRASCMFVLAHVHARGHPHILGSKSHLQMSMDQYGFEPLNRQSQDGSSLQEEWLAHPWFLTRR